MGIWNAVKGAALGSVAGPMGVIPGAALGGLGGSDVSLGGVKNWLLGGNATEGMPTRPEHADFMGNYLTQQLGQVQGRPAPTMNAAQIANGGQLNPAQQMAARGQMQTLADRLGGVATGNTAGAGELAVNRQAGQALADQTSRAMMSRGGGSALAARNAARNSADIGLGAAGQAAIAQTNDQTGANQQLAGLLGGMRGQDIDVARANQGGDIAQAGLTQQANQSNQSAQLAQSQMNQQGQLGYLATLLGVDQAVLQQDLARRGLAAQDKGMLPGLLQMGGTVAASMAGKPA